MENTEGEYYSTIHYYFADVVSNIELCQVLIYY